DQPFAGAQGREAARHRFRRAVLANPGNEPAGGREGMNALLRILAWTLAICLVVAPVVAVLNGWIGGSRWPMRHLVVTGEFRQVSDLRVRAVVQPNVQAGFFSGDLDNCARR